MIWEKIIFRTYNAFAAVIAYLFCSYLIRRNYFRRNLTLTTKIKRAERLIGDYLNMKICRSMVAQASNSPRPAYILMGSSASKY